MSRCEEYRQKMLDVENEIRKLGDDYDMWDDRPRQRKIQTLEQHRQILEEKWKQSMRRGGC